MRSLPAGTTPGSGARLPFGVRSSQHAELDARLLTVLRAGGRMTPASIGRELGLDRTGIRLRLTRLHRLGLARFVGETDAPRSWGVQAPESVWEAIPQSDREP